MRTDTEVVSRSVILTPRTPRAVVVLPETDRAINGIGMRSPLHRALEWLGRTWGGAHMLVTPVVDGAVPVVFERLVRAYDPDLVVQWAPNIAEIAGRDLSRARSIRADRARTVALAEDEDSAFSIQDTGEDDAELLADLRVVGPRESDTEACIALSDKVAGFVDVSPSSSTRFGVEQAFHMQQVLPGPLTLTERLFATPSTNTAGSWGAARAHQMSVSRSILDIDIEPLDPWLTTMLKIRLGVAGVGGRDVLGDRPTDENPVSRTFDPKIQSYVDEATRFAVYGAVTRTEPGSWCSPEAITQAPMVRSEVGLDVYLWDDRRRSPMLIVVGDSVADAALYLCWTRIYGPHTGAWLPSSVLDVIRCPAASSDSDHPADDLLEYVKELFSMVPSPLYGKAFITSFSESVADLEGLRSRMNDHRFWLESVNSLVASMVAVNPEDLPVSQHRSTLVAFPQTVMTSISVMFRDGVAQSPVRSPVPPMVAPLLSRSAEEVNWVCDAIVDDTRWPVLRSTAEFAEVVPRQTESLARRGLLRFGSTGTAWVARNADTLMPGVNPEHGLHAPTLRSVEIGLALDAAIAPGWTWQLSSAGRFYLGFEELAGGLDEALALLRDTTTRSVMRTFVTGPRKDTGYPVDGRWYLAFPQFVAAIEIASNDALDESAANDGTTIEVTQAIDLLTSLRILIRGLKLDCKRCSRTGFYRLDVLSHVFACDRCSQVQDLGIEAWRDAAGNAEPQWFYALDEVAYQALNQDIEGPLFALAALGANNPDVLYSWPIQLIPPVDPAVDPPTVKRSEVDFVVLHDSRLTVGEAKTNNHLGDSATKRQISTEIGKTDWAARRLRAHTIVFATTRSAWGTGTREALDSYAPRNMSVTILEGLA